jgi:hypothetical protein
MLDEALLPLRQHPCQLGAFHCCDSGSQRQHKSLLNHLELVDCSWSPRLWPPFGRFWPQVVCVRASFRLQELRLTNMCSVGGLVLGSIGSAVAGSAKNINTLVGAQVLNGLGAVPMIA